MHLLLSLDYSDRHDDRHKRHKPEIAAGNKQSRLCLRYLGVITFHAIASLNDKFVVADCQSTADGESSFHHRISETRPNVFLISVFNEILLLTTINQPHIQTRRLSSESNSTRIAKFPIFFLNVSIFTCSCDYCTSMRVVTHWRDHLLPVAISDIAEKVKSHSQPNKVFGELTFQSLKARLHQGNGNMLLVRATCCLYLGNMYPFVSSNRRATNWQQFC